MGVHDPLGRGQFGAQGLDLQDLCRGPLNIATYKIHKPWASCLHIKFEEICPRGFIREVVKGVNGRTDGRRTESDQNSSS